MRFDTDFQASFRQVKLVLLTSQISHFHVFKEVFYIMGNKVQCCGVFRVFHIPQHTYRLYRIIYHGE